MCAHCLVVRTGPGRHGEVAVSGEVGLSGGLIIQANRGVGFGCHSRMHGACENEGGGAGHQ
ncbi:hypothetical protein GALL_544120 [mine drainage metagenome]|uniref:Uncharacterized protein n=1 Tax=mine drainage metagenome TaxID=410659 RepID=A0A1J5NZ33_9ZZZZ